MFQRKIKTDNKKEEFRSVWLLLFGFCIAAEEQETVIARNSSLTEYIYLSPNAGFPRKHEISRITIHHMAGDFTLEEVGSTFSDRDRRVSANYGIDSEGRIALYVEESNCAWTSHSRENDDQAVTIEVANDEPGGTWHVSDEAYAALLDLCTDICRRNGIEELRFTGDTDGNLTLHKMFYGETECPGPYLESRMNDIAAAVNARLDQEETSVGSFSMFLLSMPCRSAII